MPQRGKLVVLVFFFMGLTLALGAVGYHYAKTRWALAYWGQDAARLIARASEVELLRLEPSQDQKMDELAQLPDQTPAANLPPLENSDLKAKLSSSEWVEILTFDGQRKAVVEKLDITQTPGLIHMRMALLEDANFDVKARPRANRHWDYVFRFSDSQQTLLIAVDSLQGLVGVIDPAGKQPMSVANIGPISAGMQKFLRVQFEVDTESKTIPKAEAEPANVKVSIPPADRTPPATSEAPADAAESAAP